MVLDFYSFPVGQLLVGLAGLNKSAMCASVKKKNLDQLVLYNLKVHVLISLVFPPAGGAVSELRHSQSLKLSRLLHTVVPSSSPSTYVKQRNVTAGQIPVTSQVGIPAPQRHILRHPLHLPLEYFQVPM